MVLASTSVLVVKQAPHNDCCQCLCPQGGSQLPPVSPGGSPRSASGSDPGSFQIPASVLGLEPVRFCVHPLRVKSLFPIALQLSWTQALLAFKARCSGGSSSQWEPWARGPDLGLGPLAPRGEPLQL